MPPTYVLPRRIRGKICKICDEIFQTGVSHQVVCFKEECQKTNKHQAALQYKLHHQPVSRSKTPKMLAKKVTRNATAFGVALRGGSIADEKFQYALYWVERRAVKALELLKKEEPKKFFGATVVPVSLTYETVV